MNDHMEGFTIGMLIGLLLGAMLGIVIANETEGLAKTAFDAIKHCEKSLPRNQECEVYAKPKEIKL